MKARSRSSIGAFAIATAVATLGGGAPTHAAAAQGRPGILGRARSGLTGGGPVIVVPQQLNAVNVLIQHRQELALTDSQFARVVAIKRAVDSANTPFVRKADSVQRLFKSRPLFAEETPARRDSIAEGRAVVNEAVAAIRDNLADARERAFGLLSSAQFERAAQLVAAAQQQLDDETQRAGRGRGSGPPGS